MGQTVASGLRKLCDGAIVLWNIIFPCTHEFCFPVKKNNKIHLVCSSCLDDIT